MTIFVCFENRTGKHTHCILIAFLFQQTTFLNVGSKGKLQIRFTTLFPTKMDKKCSILIKLSTFATIVSITRTAIFVFYRLPFHLCLPPSSYSLPVRIASQISPILQPGYLHNLQTTRPLQQESTKQPQYLLSFCYQKAIRGCYHGGKSVLFRICIIPSDCELGKQFPVRTAAPAALQINQTHCRAHEALLPCLPQLYKWQNNGQQSPAVHLLTVLE